MSNTYLVSATILNPLDTTPFEIVTRTYQATSSEQAIARLTTVLRQQQTAGFIFGFFIPTATVTD